MKIQKYVPNGIRGEPKGKIKKCPMLNDQYRISKMMNSRSYHVHKFKCPEPMALKGVTVIIAMDGINSILTK